MASKYGKLLLNLSNIVEAALGSGAATAVFQSVLRARGARRCSPRPASPGVTSAPPTRAATALMRRGAIAGVARAGGSSTQSLARGTGSIETDWLNGEIVLLGRLHGVPVPANA